MDITRTFPVVKLPLPVCHLTGVVFQVSYGVLVVGFEGGSYRGGTVVVT